MIRHRSQSHKDGAEISETPVQSFTEGIGRRYFAVQISRVDSRTAIQADQITEELELFDALLEGDGERSFAMVESHQLSPWLQRTGWISHLGHYPLQPLAMSVTYDNLKKGSSTSVLAVLAKVAVVFDKIWANAEKLMEGGLTNSVLTLLKTNKRDTYSNQDVTPFKLPEHKTTCARYRKIWLTYVMFCVRCYLENLEGEPQFYIHDSQRLIVAPHLLAMRIFPEVPEMGDVTLTSGLHRYFRSYLKPHIQGTNFFIIF